MTSPTHLDTEEASRRRSTPLPGSPLGQPAAGTDYDGRREYVRPPGAPKPPPEIWAELEAAGQEAGERYLTSPRYLIAHARYKAWAAEQGWREGIHGVELPEGAIR